ncbi:SGNH/GDSL hydrolase family protein [Pelomonas sp. KK5]|uniref:SGNH/GDSL hydrolase family protein n=1 Tax=Pelomonas sp. KK5 TaxID=1855730 RepID=UPI00097C2DBE|nr:SGNH/GDSL hydrolase family protein [Pelomonas sp. KK5]
MTHAITHSFLSAALATLLASTSAAAAPPPGTPAFWQPSWISPAQPAWSDGWIVPLGMPSLLRDVTLRQSLRSSLGGEQLRLVISNQYGVAPLAVGTLTVRGGGEAAARTVRFQGRDGAVVAPGARVISDPVGLPVQAGERLEVDLHLPGPSAPAGFHWDAQERTEVFKGNTAGRRGAPVLETLSTRAFVSELWVESARAPTAVVTIGDSITDGNGSSIGQDRRWPDQLARRLAPRGIAVLNAGIAGNRLLRGGWGESALARFERDALGHRGVRAVIVLLGTNDIGFPGSPFAPSEAPASLNDITDAFLQLAEQAHARQVRLVVGTVPPFEHALAGTPMEGHYSPRKEALRKALNDWIRRVGAFDAVVDFDAVLRDPAHPTQLDPALDSGDHLHPGDAGYRRMAEAVDLEALLGADVGPHPPQAIRR